MTKATNARNSARSRTAKRLTEETPIVAADTTIDNDTQQVVEQTPELEAAITESEQPSDAAVIDAQEFMAEPDDLVEEIGSTESPAEAPVAEATEEPVAEEAPAAPVVAADPFADLPMTKIEDYEFRDLTDAVGNNPFKYEAIHKAATEAKLPMKPNWKHSSAMVVVGTNRRDFKEGSVYGTIFQIVQQYGRAGVPAYVLVAKVRQAQIGNKRSKYCVALPPIGWAEGWIDSFISKNHGKVMADKKAPPVTQQIVDLVKQGDEAAQKEADRLAA